MRFIAIRQETSFKNDALNDLVTVDMGLVWHMLAEPKTLEETTQDILEYCKDYREDFKPPFYFEVYKDYYVAWCIIKLLELGLIELYQGED